ncbi:MAG: hypothetical protein GY835_00860 [bacterium]|nr:hypothetical protein [bacterium]
MAASSFNGVLKAWEGGSVTIINPQSYTVSKITDGISFESYSATLSVVADDYIKLTFIHQKKNEEQPVEQFIPVAWIKRASTWGDQHYIQL